MTVASRRAPRLIGAIFAAAILAVGIPVSGSAEPSDSPTVSNKASATPRVPASQRSRSPGVHRRSWSIEDALPGRPQSSDASMPKREFGQIPLQSGTLSLETKSQVDVHESPENRRLPGLEVDNHNKPSYLGFSLSVPTKLFSTPMQSTAPASGPPE